jgi:hypothetical protein
MPGATLQNRYDALYQQILDWYVENDIQDRLDCLKSTFVESRNGMKLRCSAAKCRALVPFVAKLCTELCDSNDPVEDAMCRAAHHLELAYDALSSSCDNAREQMAQNGLGFARQYIALHDNLHEADDRVWRLKPKLHLFLHLCLDGGDPSLHWCYRDESFGGTVARIAHRRGGQMSVTATSSSVLQAFRAGTPRVSIR